MPRGSGLHSQLIAKRREFEKAIADIDNVIRIAGGKLTGRGRGVRRPMSEEQKRKISEAATKRHAKARREATHSHKPKAINRPRPKEQGGDRAEAASA